jgi:hypothetical protein
MKKSRESGIFYWYVFRSSSVLQAPHWCTFFGK